MLTGSDSAPAKANEAKQANDIGAMKDEIALVAQNAQMDAYNDVYVDNNSTVTRGQASTVVGQKVIDEILKHFGKSARGTSTGKIDEQAQKGNVTVKIVQEFEKDAKITVSTTDIEKEGSVAYKGGALTWGIITPTGGDVTPGTPLPIGTAVAYSTTLHNNVPLSNWKVFLSDEDYTYLIYGDYLPNSAIDTSNFSGIGKYTEDYGIYADDNRIQLLNAMTTKSNWENLLSGTLNGESITQTSSENVWAMGAPTLELWVNSWNSNTGYPTLYTTQTSSAMSDGIKGYYVGNSPNPESEYLDLSNTTGAGNKLYFPHTSEEDISMGINGYWLASASASDIKEILEVNYGDDISYDLYSYGSYNDTGVTFRPIIKLPTSILNQ